MVGPVAPVAGSARCAVVAELVVVELAALSCVQNVDLSALHVLRKLGSHLGEESCRSMAMKERSEQS